MGRGKNRESNVVRSIRNMVDSADDQCSLIKNRWKENYDMFVYGTRTDQKEEWQTKFSVNKLQTSIRTAQGRLVNTLVNTPDWYELTPRSSLNRNADLLAPAFQKLLDYYLQAANFKKHAGTFFFCSLISTGTMHFGWTQRMVQNPEYILEKTKKERQKEQARLAKNVANPQVEPELSGDDMEAALIEAIEEFAAEAQGDVAPKKKIEPYIQVGCLDLMDVNHEKIYWDPNVQYMEDSIWRAFRYEVNLYELKYLAKLGLFSKEKINSIGSQKDQTVKLSTSNLRYKNTVSSPRGKEDLVELLVYYGPLIIDGEIVKDKYYCVIANNSTILKEGDYPYWEPPGHHTPILTAAVRQVPYRATGAGIGDNAVELQKVYDSNWQLVCDTFRFGISGINVVNYQNLVDKSQLDEGIYPGMTLEVRGVPKDSFDRIDLTSNIENQAHPVQNMLEQAIDSLTGINELMTGGGNKYSRTPAAETNARLEAGSDNVNIIALDLEQNFLIPALEKCFARVLQFGIEELSSNPELQSLLTEEEQQMIAEMSAGGRMSILNQWYSFKIKGFSSTQDKDAQAMRDNELLQMINSGGILASLINVPEFLKRYFRNRDIKDPQVLLMQDTPLAQVTSENQVLMAGHLIIPSQQDDHDFHIQTHGPLAQSPFATPEMQQHFQMHLQAKQQMEMAQQQQQAPNQGPPIQ